MPRIFELSDLLFPVEEHPVYAWVRDKAGDLRLPIRGKKAIIDKENRRVLGVVSGDYRLLSNEEALGLGYECCQAVFPQTKASEWEVTRVDAPSTAGHCAIDLAHKSNALGFSVFERSERPDVFGPFVRVSNSYNGMRALSFHIGFYRKVCKNGMIAPSTIVRFRWSHLKHSMREAIKFEVNKEQLAKLQAVFTESIIGLSKIPVPKAKFPSLVQGVLRLRRPDPFDPDHPTSKDWATLIVGIDRLAHRYCDELGENAYALFNALTDFASHPPVNRCLRRDSHSLQRLTGTWLTAFSAECAKAAFSLDDYISELSKPKSAESGNPHTNN